MPDDLKERLSQLPFNIDKKGNCDNQPCTGAHHIFVKRDRPSILVIAWVPCDNPTWNPSRAWQTECPRCRSEATGTFTATLPDHIVNDPDEYEGLLRQLTEPVH